MRRFDWAARMFSVIEDHQSRAFSWGENDCCMFVARVVDAMTDSTLDAQLTHTDEASARAFIAEHGGLTQAVSTFLGDPSEGRATRGDVVLFDGGEGDAVGICLGGEIVGMGPRGMQLVPRSEIKAFWVIA